MQEFSRILTALGAVVASSGLIIYGVGASFVTPGDFETSVGLWMMILGVIATVIGWLMYHRSWVEED